MDQFGHQIALNYKSSSTYKTRFGGFVTTLVFMIVITQIVVKGIFMYMRNNPEFTTNKVLQHNDDLRAYADDSAFEFAISFLSIRPYKLVRNDPRIA